MKELSNVGTILSRHAKNEMLSLRKQALKLGISASYLCDLYYGNREITAPVVEKFAAAYRYIYTDDELVALITNCVGEDIFRRYKLRVHETDNMSAAKNIFFVLYGVSL